MIDLKVLAIKSIIYVEDMELVSKFYCSVFGFKETYSSEYWKQIEHVQGTIIGLHKNNNTILPKETGLSFGVEDLERAVVVIKSQNGIFDKMIEESESIKVARILDPEGNILSLVQLTA